MFLERAFKKSDKTLTTPHCKACAHALMFIFVHPPLTCPSLKCPLVPFPFLTPLLSANRLAHPEGSLPDLAMMSLTASLDKPEAKQLSEFGEGKPERCSEKVEKGELGKDSEEDEEDEDEEGEEETSGNPPTTSRMMADRPVNETLACTKQIYTCI